MLRFNSKILFVTALLALTVVISWAIFFPIKKILSYSTYRYISFYSGHHKTFPQVLLIGNSRAGSNFSNVAFSPGNLLNLGMGGMTFQILSLQALDMIEINPKLKFVVIEPYFLRDKYVVVRQGHIQALFSDRIKKQVSLLFSEFESLVAMVFPSYWLNTSNFMGALGYAIIDEPISHHSSDRSFDLGRLGPLIIQKNKTLTYGGIDSSTIKQLSDLSQACKKSGVTLLILATPIHSLRSESHGWKSHISDIRQIASDLNIEFYDFSSFFSGERMFADTVHLNSSGADFMSEVLWRKTLGNEVRGGHGLLKQ